MCISQKKGKTKILHMLAFLLYEFVNYVGKISKEEVCSIFLSFFIFWFFLIFCFFFIFSSTFFLAFVFLLTHFLCNPTDMAAAIHRKRNLMLGKGVGSKDVLQVPGVGLALILSSSSFSQVQP